MKHIKKVEYPGIDRPVPVIRTPVSLSEIPSEPFKRAPLLGEHTDKILTELGYTEEEIKELRQKRVV